LYGADLKPVQPELVMKFQAWLDALPDAPLEFIGTNFAPFAAALATSRFRGADVVDVTGTLAGVIARIAYNELVHGRAVDPAAVDANYVRRSDAELMWREV
jgi:tRNA threonylcarbamoyladenosine biosynthesis protein TsaB